MELVYACLIGEWVCLNNDDTCTINEVDADIWFKDNADIFNPKVVQVEHTYYQMPYVNINYKGVKYRINPTFIQIVTK